LHFDPFLQFHEAEEGSDGKHQAIVTLLLPVARGICPHWETGNRREAGAALAHIAASGKEPAMLHSLFHAN
jgi:hypothetical protein